MAFLPINFNRGIDTNVPNKVTLALHATLTKTLPLS